MSYSVEVIEGVGRGRKNNFGVKVDGHMLCDKRGRYRRFGDSFAAAIAGAKQVDLLRRIAKLRSEGNSVPPKGADHG